MRSCRSSSCVGRLRLRGWCGAGWPGGLNNRFLVPFRRQGIFRDQKLVGVNLQALVIQQHFHRLAVLAGHPVIVAIARDEAVLIHMSRQFQIRSAQLRRHADQMGTLVLKGLCWDQPGLANGPVIHPHRGPFQGLAVEILHVLEDAPGQEVGLDGVKRAFLAGLAVGVAQRMTAENESVGLREARHFRNDEGLGTRATQTGQVGVVDDAFLGGIAQKGERLVKKAFHLEAVEGSVELQIATFGVAKIQQAGDHGFPALAQQHLIDGGVVLHLGARLVGHAVATRLGAACRDAIPAAAGHGGIGDLDFMLLDQFLSHPLDVSLALRVETPEQFLADGYFAAA